VVVLGGGPAGAACAIALARRGASVAVLERTRYEAPRVGETLPPAVARPLSGLGVWERFRAAGHQPAPGFVVAWGSDEPYENDHIFSPYGPGWRLDRARFDALLVEAAEAEGASVFREARVAACERNPKAGWRVRTRVGASSREMSAAWVIDATGRAAWLARRQGAERRAFDRLVALIRFGAPAPTGDPRTVIEACADGWWYLAPLGSGRAVVALFTDHDLIPRGAAGLQRWWDERLRRSDLVGPRVGRVGESASLRCIPAHSAKLSRIAGSDWLAVGDAAQSRDPLSGQGVVTALGMGLHAASVVAWRSAGDRASADDFTDGARQAFGQYLARRSAYYALEARWPRSEFWRRRRPQ
jgi:flavin-dependent dehydrogenase